MSVAIVLIAATAVAILVANFGREESFAGGNSGNAAAEVVFLNTYNNANYGLNIKATETTEGTMLGNNAATIIKTEGGKYVLLDTGISNEKENGKVKQIIKDALREYQYGGGSGKLTIDYLIVSHLDQDHYGNAATLIGDSEVNVKNVIIKYEGKLMSTNETKRVAFDTIVAATRNEGAGLYTNASSYKVNNIAVSEYENYHRMDTEGINSSESTAMIEVDNGLTLYFYNTQDVYLDAEKPCDEKYYVLSFKKAKLDENGEAIDDGFLKDSNGYYLRFDNTDNSYPNVKYERTKSLKRINNDNFKNYFYAYLQRNSYDTAYKKQTSCLANGNSYTVLAEVKTNAGNRYMYFGNDIDNTGYGFAATTEDVSYTNANGQTVTDRGHKVVGQKMWLKSKNADEIITSNGLNPNVIAENKAYSETKAALEVADKLKKSSSLNDIVIYQASHHGNDNASDAIEALDLNRSNVYVVASRRTGFGSIHDLAYVSRFLNYTFDFKVNVANGPKFLYPGQNENSNGVFCTIAQDGSNKCADASYALNYNLNGGTGEVEAASCLANVVSVVNGEKKRSCNIPISEATPTRSGYKFLGWAAQANATGADFVTGNKIIMSDDRTIYAIWAPIRTLTYDPNGGDGAPVAQKCNPTSTTGSCKVTVSAGIPTRSGYEFMGWGTSADATSINYAAGSPAILKANKTIYAIWKRAIDINTSVSDGGGTITPSISDVVFGNKVTINFTPYSGYEIDAVTVNGEIAEVQDSQLILTAGEENLNVTVTYRLVSTPEPSSTQTFYMYFNEVNGGTGFPGTQQCTTTLANPSECEITIPNTIPTLDDYVFLGYGTLTNRNTVAYEPGRTYTIDANVYLLGVWGHIYTLSYNTNGGSGEFTGATCNATEAQGACTVLVDTNRPTMDGKEFLGWATDASADMPEYLPNDNFAFAHGVWDVTLYAVWGTGGVEWIQAQDYAVGSGADMIVRFNYPLENFVALKIDGELVDGTNYELRSGSTVVTFKSDYVDTLGIGSHTLVAEYDNDISITTTFAIYSPEIPDDPDEGSDEDPDEDAEDESEDGDKTVPGNTSGDVVTPDTGRNTETKDGGISVVLQILPISAILILGGWKIKNNHGKCRKFD